MAMAMKDLQIDLGQVDFDEVCALLKVSAPLHIKDLQQMYKCLLNKVYNRFIFYWEINPAYESEKTEHLTAFWKKNFIDTKKSRNHQLQWLHGLQSKCNKQQSNDTFPLEQCISCFNRCIAKPAVKKLTTTTMLLTTSSPADAWIKLSDQHGDYLYNVFSGNERRVSPQAVPCLLQSKAHSVPLKDALVPSTPPKSMNRSKSSTPRNVIPDAVVKFQSILELSNPIKLQEELRTQINWESLLIGVYSVLDNKQRQTLYSTLKQIAQHLFENSDRYRTIYTSNKTIKKKLLSHPGGAEFLHGLGFARVSPDKLVCDSPCPEVVTAALCALKRTHKAHTKSSTYLGVSAVSSMSSVMSMSSISNVTDETTIGPENMREDLVDIMQRVRQFNKTYTGFGKLDEMPSQTQIDDCVHCVHRLVSNLASIAGDMDIILPSETPGAESYQTWDLHQTMAWIATLEKGRFNKYCATLRKGFMSDQVSAASLPYVTKQDLRREPFNIMSLPDRTALSEHFAGLLAEHKTSKGGPVKKKISWSAQKPSEGSSANGTAYIER